MVSLSYSTFDCLSSLSLLSVVIHMSLVHDAVQDLLRGFPDHCYRLQRYRQELRSFQRRRWDDAWNEIVRPLFDDS